MSEGSENRPEKGAPAVGGPAPQRVRIFTYPKIIFIVPTLIAALVCGIGMMIISDETEDPADPVVVAAADPAPVDAEAAPADAEAAPADADTAPADAEAAPADADTAPVAGGTGAGRVVESRSRFGSTQNVLAMAFLFVFSLNLLIMSVDFPRFTVIALVLLFAALGFFVLWLNVYFELLPPLVRVLENIFAAANSTFYFLFATAILVNFAIIWFTRYLDYWEIMPNEILHNHGPFSDLERYPTFQLKFDKEIPDILEYALLRSGRLVLHIYGEQRAIVLDNVLWINSKEDDLKRLMSRMEVRVSSDREVIEPS